MQATHQQGRMVHAFCAPPPPTPASPACQHLAEKQENQKLKISRTQGVLGQSGLGEGKRGKKSAEDYSKTQLTTRLPATSCPVHAAL